MAAKKPIGVISIGSNDIHLLVAATDGVATFERQVNQAMLAELVGAVKGGVVPVKALLTKTGHVPCKRAPIIRWPVHNRNRTARNTNQLIVFIGDLHIPHLRRAPAMNRRRYPGQLPVAFRSQVIGVDLQSKSHLLAGINIQNSTE